MGELSETISLDEATSNGSFYRPLIPEQIRVLRILPGQSNEPIETFLLRATLVAAEGVRLDEEDYDICVVPFIALSYAWGSPIATREISCNGHRFMVTPRLESALQRVRSRHQELYLWTDRICINQADLEEKGKQVRLMFRLFQKAQKVFCYLGHASKQYEDLLRKLSLFRIQREERPHLGVRSLERSELERIRDGSGMYSRRTSGTRTNSLDTPAFAETCQQILETYPHLVERAEEFVISCDWFFRTWIRQEVFAAKTLEVACGTYQFDLEDLHQLVQNAGFHRPELIPFKTLMANLPFKSQKRSFDSKNTKQTPFVNLVLSNATGFRASNDLDRIYALQNIALSHDDQTYALMPDIDYSKDTVRLYAEFTKRVMYQNGRLQMLSIVERKKFVDPLKWPSWLIDFRENVPRVLLYPELSISRDDRPHASLIEELLPQEIARLRLRGVCLGNVGKPTSFDNWHTFDQNYSPLGCGCVQGPMTYGSKGVFDGVMLRDVMHYTCSMFNRSARTRNWLQTITYDDWTYPGPSEKILTTEVVQEGDMVVLFDEGVTFFHFAHDYHCNHRLSNTGIITECGDSFSVIRPLKTEPKTYMFLGPAFIVSQAYVSIDNLDIYNAPATKFIRSVSWAKSRSIVEDLSEEFILV